MARWLEFSCTNCLIVANATVDLPWLRLPLIKIMFPLVIGLARSIRIWPLYNCWETSLRCRATGGNGYWRSTIVYFEFDLSSLKQFWFWPHFVLRKNVWGTSNLRSSLFSRLDWVLSNNSAFVWNSLRLKTIADCFYCPSKMLIILPNYHELEESLMVSISSLTIVIFPFLSISYSSGFFALSGTLSGMSTLPIIFIISSTSSCLFCLRLVLAYLNWVCIIGAALKDRCYLHKLAYYLNISASDG